MIYHLSLLDYFTQTIQVHKKFPEVRNSCSITHLKSLIFSELQNEISAHFISRKSVFILAPLYFRYETEIYTKFLQKSA